MLIFTHSDIQAFLSCRRQFLWQYVQDWREPPRKYGYLELGTRVHKTLEYLYTPGTGTKDPIAYHDDLGKRDVAKQIELGGPVWGMDQLYEDIIIGRNCITAYMEWLEKTGADAGYEVVSTEETVEAPMLGGKVLLRGKVDVKFRRLSDGGILINDWKTSGGFRAGQRELLERSYQHNVYMAIERLNAPDGVWIAGAWYTVLKKTKNRRTARGPMVERFSVPATERQAVHKHKQIENILEEMLRLMEMAADGGDSLMYPTPQDLCRFCAYKQPCELQDENPLAARAMLDANFVRGGRHERYDD